MTASEDTPPATDFDPARMELGGRIGQQCARLTRLFAAAKHDLAEMRVNGLEHAGYLLLAWLVNDGPQRNAALAELSHFDPSTVSRLVGTLARRGLVERRADPTDGRASLIAATTAGETLLADYRTQRDTRIAGALADWEVADQEALATLLPRLYTAFEAMLPDDDAAKDRCGAPASGEHLYRGTPTHDHPPSAGPTGRGPTTSERATKP